MDVCNRLGGQSGGRGRGLTGWSAVGGHGGIHDSLSLPHLSCMYSGTRSGTLAPVVARVQAKGRLFPFCTNLPRNTTCGPAPHLFRQVWGLAFAAEHSCHTLLVYVCSYQVWDLAGGFCTHSFSGHGGVVLRVAFHPKSLQLFSAADDGGVRVWDLVDKSCVYSLKVGACV